MGALQLSDNIYFCHMGRRPRIDRVRMKPWLKAIASRYRKNIDNLNYTFCTDEELLEINIHYLKHNYYTDIITFELSDTKSIIEGDIYISIDRVKDNAKTNNCIFEVELRRVIAHGLLHLIGFKDKTKKEIKEMREAEDFALMLWDTIQVSRETDSESQHN